MLPLSLGRHQVRQDSCHETMWIWNFENCKYASRSNNTIRTCPLFLLLFFPFSPFTPYFLLCLFSFTLFLCSCLFSIFCFPFSYFSSLHSPHRWRRSTNGALSFRGRRWEPLAQVIEFLKYFSCAMEQRKPIVYQLCALRRTWGFYNYYWKCILCIVVFCF